MADADGQDERDQREPDAARPEPPPDAVTTGDVPAVPMPPPTGATPADATIPTPAPTEPPATDAQDAEPAPDPAAAAQAKLRPAPRRRARRGWAQRVVLTVNCIVVLACFAGSAAVAYSTAKLNDRLLVKIRNPADTAPSTIPTSAPDDSLPDEPGPPDPEETFPEADPQALNYLITGEDNKDCLDPDSPFAGGVGDRSGGGQRSDTIMVMRVEPGTRQAAILSFPRDLLVQIGSRKNKINSAYKRNQPQLLIETIWKNYGIGIDHYIQIDLCAFMTIVDAVGGVTVPFDYRVRDEETGLNIAEAGCFTFTGEHAQAYVRSRKLQYLDPATGTWKDDRFYDLSRISRQQDFIRRTLSSALKFEITNPLVAKRLIDAVLPNIATDDGMTINRMLSLAGLLRDFDPTTVRNFQIDSHPDWYSGQSVQIADIDNDNMRAVLAVFRGEARLAPPTEPGTDEPSTTTDPGATATTIDTGPTTTATPGEEPTATTLPTVVAQENDRGFVPSREVQC